MTFALGGGAQGYPKRWQKEHSQMICVRDKWVYNPKIMRTSYVHTPQPKALNNGAHLLAWRSKNNSIYIFELFQYNFTFLQNMFLSLNCVCVYDLFTKLARVGSRSSAGTNFKSDRLRRYDMCNLFQISGSLVSFVDTCQVHLCGSTDRYHMAKRPLQCTTIPTMLACFTPSPSLLP